MAVNVTHKNDENLKTKIIYEKKISKISDKPMAIWAPHFYDESLTISLICPIHWVCILK